MNIEIPDHLLDYDHARKMVAIFGKAFLTMAATYEADDAMDGSSHRMTEIESLIDVGGQILSGVKDHALTIVGF